MIAPGHQLMWTKRSLQQQSLCSSGQPVAIIVCCSENAFSEALMSWDLQVAAYLLLEINALQMLF